MNRSKPRYRACSALISWMGACLLGGTDIAHAGGPAVLATESFGSSVVEEGGNGDSYTLELSNQPSGNVTVTVQPGTQFNVVSSSILTFTTSNWNVPQTVLLEAIDDAVSEGTHFDLAVHTVSGGGFNGAAAPTLLVEILDNDRAVTDLAVSMQLLTNPIGPGQRISYLVEVENLSTENAQTPYFAMGLPNDTDNMSWNCVADPGASCPMSGLGPPMHLISLPGGTQVSYLVDIDISPLAAEGTAITAIATVEANDSFDPELSNNSASRTDVLGPDRLFNDGFDP